MATSEPTLAERIAASAARLPVDWTETYIYALLDPETGAVRYIGQSIRPLERLKNHINEQSNCHRSHWLQSLKRKGLKPELRILESVAGEWPWQEAERYWIARGRREGWPLTNNTTGGDGVRDLPAETRAKMAATWKGRKHRPESIEKMKVVRRGRVTSEETRAKMSASQTGRVITWGAKLSAANTKLTAEQAADVMRRRAAGEKLADIARSLSIHRTTLSKIKTGKYVPRPEPGK